MDVSLCLGAALAVCSSKCCAFQWYSFLVEVYVVVHVMRPDGVPGEHLE